ncbi:type II toxin-antitoxin system RelE/ParE family toxin [Candidatus Peregrinibacteria bacterium]|nr:type II toxin-antitoxin system RelE/ParE family toxin [Candidatus Peregrinibacteria bacterium]
MDKIQKFLLSLSKAERSILSAILGDIRLWKIGKYDVKPLKGYKGFFRLRTGKIRIVFAQSGDMGVIINIGYRKDVYKNL